MRNSTYLNQGRINRYIWNQQNWRSYQYTRMYETSHVVKYRVYSELNLIYRAQIHASSLLSRLSEPYVIHRRRTQREFVPKHSSVVYGKGEIHGELRALIQCMGICMWLVYLLVGVIVVVYLVVLIMSGRCIQDSSVPVT